MSGSGPLLGLGSRARIWARVRAWTLARVQFERHCRQTAEETLRKLAIPERSRSDGPKSKNARGKWLERYFHAWITLAILALSRPSLVRAKGPSNPFSMHRHLCSMTGAKCQNSHMVKSLGEQCSKDGRDGAFLLFGPSTWIKTIIHDMPYLNGCYGRSLWQLAPQTCRV